MQVINQAETEVKLYRTDELIPGHTYIVTKSPNYEELVGRVVITTQEKIHTNGKIIIGIDNEGYSWFQQDSESQGYLLREVNAEIHIKELL
jgi:hypothetical protein